MSVATKVATEGVHN